MALISRSAVAITRYEKVQTIKHKAPTAGEQLARNTLLCDHESDTNKTAMKKLFILREKLF